MTATASAPVRRHLQQDRFGCRGMSAPVSVGSGSRLLPPTIVERLDDYPAAAIAVAHAKDRLAECIRLPDVAMLAGMSAAAFSRSFAEKVGMPFSAVLRVLRIERALELLERRDCSVAMLASRAGYRNACTFARAFKGVVGETPSSYRRRYLSSN